MILQALKEYYERKVGDGSIAPDGWEYREIPYVIVLDDKGDLIQIENTQEQYGTNKRSRRFLVPRSEPRTGNIKANLLWDKAEYIFEDIEVNKRTDRMANQRAAFKARLENELGDIECIKTLLLLLNNKDLKEKLTKESCWEDIKKRNPLITFRFHNELGLICNRKEVVTKINMNNAGYLDNRYQDDAHQGICLVSGNMAAISRIHGKTFINRKNNSLVSFQKNSGYDSYGKTQAYNAPISKSVEFAYVTALNTLLKSKKQKFEIGDGVYVCWSADKTNFENEFTSFFEDSSSRDNPDQFSEKVKALIESIYTGALIRDEASLRFYILGLSPGGGTRISVRFWDSNTIGKYAYNIAQYFEDLAICKPPSYPLYFSLARLLSSVAQQGDRSKIPPELAGRMVASIVCNIPFPNFLLQAAIRRIHSGIKIKTKLGSEKIERVTPEIASIIKAYLNRYYRFYFNNYEGVSFELDINQSSIGYQLGRLFATLERIQEEANPGINSTITERFYGAACSTPVTVFANLLRLKNHHIAKLPSKGRVIFFNQLIGEIMEKVDDFPSYLDLHEQGRFAIGYYHQRQAFYSPNTTVKQ